MPSQWSRQHRNMMGKDWLILIFGIVIIGSFVNIIYSHINPAVAATSSADVNIPSTDNINDPNSSGYPIQNSSSVNNTLKSENGNNNTITGYWVLFVSNGAFQQFSINAQVYTFLQGLTGRDSKGTGTIKVYLVNNDKFINTLSVTRCIQSYPIWRLLTHLHPLSLQIPLLIPPQMLLLMPLQVLLLMFYRSYS